MNQSLLSSIRPIYRLKRTYFLIDQLNLRISITNRLLLNRTLFSILDISDKIENLNSFELTNADSNKFYQIVNDCFYISNDYVLLRGKFIYRSFPDKYSSFMVRDCYNNVTSILFIGKPRVFNTCVFSDNRFYFDSFLAIPDNLGYLLMTIK